MGDLQSEEGRDVLLEIQTPIVPSSCSDAIVTASLGYFNVITSSLDNVSAVLTLERTGKQELQNVTVVERLHVYHLIFYPLPCSFTHSLTHPLTNPLTHPFTSRTQSFTHPFTHSHVHSPFDWVRTFLSLILTQMLSLVHQTVNLTCKGTASWRQMH